MNEMNFNVANDLSALVATILNGVKNTHLKMAQEFVLLTLRKMNW